MKGALKGRQKIIVTKAFRPCRGSLICNFLPGAGAPGYHLAAPAGAASGRVSRQKLITEDQKT